MQQEIAGYRLDAELHQGPTSRVCRGVRLCDGLPVVLKILRNEFPTAQESARYQREFRIASPLRLDLAVRVLDHFQLDHRSVLVYADDGCVSLDRLYGARALDAASFLPVAIAATRALAEVHAARIIHGDVNPSNLLIHPESGRIKLTDFELARDHDAKPERGTRTVGTLAYMAPEQSGRANLQADTGADLYSLGASLFELACGRQVFIDLDDASLLHAHFAVPPPSIREFNPAFPPLLDALVLKLLAKMPADRYQSASGLLHDLEAIQQRLQASEPLDGLVLGASDQSTGLPPVERMVGRDHQLAQLQAGYEQAVHGRQPVWIRLRGAAGAGKSTLVARFADSLPAGHVLLSGGGEAQTQSVPHAALIAAFDCLLRHWLAAAEAEINAIRADLRHAMAGNLGVLEPLLPRLARVVGSLATPQALGASAELARFHATWLDFVRTAIHHQRPLVFFIDDLQWVDSASLLLLEKLLASDLAPCLLITAERADEPSPALTEWLGRLRAAAITGQLIDLQPLSRAQLGEMLDALLNCMDGGDSQRDALIEVLHTRTLGNPFFIRQLLDDLVRAGALAEGSCAAGACWHFDAQRAQSLGVADNVLSLLGNRIGSLPPELRSVLVHAACIGPRFDLATLAAVLPAPVAAALPTHLAELVGQGMLQATGDPASRQFIHERIREAALTHLQAGEAARIHLAIGRRWQQQPERGVFDIVGQLNLGRTLIGTDGERLELAQLNARAARQARRLTAYESSLGYARHAVDLLPEAQRPVLGRDLLALLADAQASAGHLEEAIATFEQALALAHDDDQRAQVLERLCDALQSSGRPAQALVQVQRALAMLGQPLALPDPGDSTAQAALAAEQDRLFAQLGDEAALQALARLDAADESAARIGRLYDKAVIGVYFSRPERLGFVTARSIAHVLATGLTPEAGLAFAWWSMILCMLDRHELATQYAQWARTTHERFGNDYYGGAGRMVAAAMTLSWTRPYAEAFAEAGEGARLLNLSGNMQFASYGLITQHIIAVAEAADCQAMLATCQAWGDYCARYVPLELGQARIRRYCIERLLGLHPEPLDCEAIVQAYAAQNNATDVCESLTEMARVALLTDDFAQALALAERAHPYFCAGAAGNLLLNFNHLVMLAIASARMAGQAQGDEQARLHAQFDQTATRVAHLAALQPQNFAAYAELVRAEGARMRDGHDTALGAYFAAIGHAQQHGYLLLQAQATQYLAELLHTRGHPFAYNLQRSAEQSYRRAGCLLKLTDQSHPGGTSATTTDLTTRRISRGTNAAHGIDVLSLMKANEAIASEIDYDRLLIRLLEITVENAGAQRGVLVLQEDAGYHVVAESIQGRLHEPLDGTTLCPVQMIHYVARSGLVSVLEHGNRRTSFRGDDYFDAHAVRSALATPVIRQGAVLGVLYLENNAVDGVFGEDRLEAIRLLLGAAAIALENATLYAAQKHYADQLEARVRERTGELEIANAALARLADLDGLTQIANRRSFDRACARFAEAEAETTLLICDVDDFKAYNDHYGHPAGDEVLRKVAAALAGIGLPSEGVVARYGGEEFAVVLRDIDEATAEQFARRVHQAVGDLHIPHRNSRAAPHVTLSVGVARRNSLSPGGIADLIGNADKALYLAKQGGRNRVSLHADFHRGDVKATC